VAAQYAESPRTRVVCGVAPAAIAVCSASVTMLDYLRAVPDIM
jgi:hypothetical protein